MFAAVNELMVSYHFFLLFLTLSFIFLQGRGLMPFSKYSPYYPLFGVRLDDQPSAFRAHKPTEKSAFEPPATGHTACQLYYNGRFSHLFR
jgi:hypothetical protein